MGNEIFTSEENIINCNEASIDLTDLNFEFEVLQSDKPVMVHFTFECEYDQKIVPFIEDLIVKYTSSVKFCKVKIKEQPNTSTKYGVILAPTILIFAYGKVVAQIVGVVPKDTIKLKIDGVLGKPSENLQELSLKDLKKAYRQSNGDWGSAMISGIVAGVIFAIARSNFTGAASLIVPGFALGFFIQNKNFKFSWLQKAFAICLMILIGMFNKELVELLRQFMK